MKRNADIVAKFCYKAIDRIFIEYRMIDASKHLIEIEIDPEWFDIDEDIIQEMSEDEFWFDYYDRKFYVINRDNKYLLLGIKK